MTKNTAPKNTTGGFPFPVIIVKAPSAGIAGRTDEKITFVQCEVVEIFLDGSDRKMRLSGATVEVGNWTTQKIGVNSDDDGTGDRLLIAAQYSNNEFLAISGDCKDMIDPPVIT